MGLLGRGGMGEVYRADDLQLGQSVALKFLPERLIADPGAIERFRREVRTARQIAHPNVCRVYDIAETDGHMYLSMEYIDGEDLAHALKRMGRPSREKAVELAREICLGLAAAHENGVLHRDLKPANIMIDGRGKARITDFGLAGLADELAIMNERAGTPGYMAPEQLEDGSVSVRSDIYSLGLILYELFTGRRAVEGETVEEIRRSRASRSSMSRPSSGEAIDPAVARVIDRCLAEAPAERPGSVYAVLGALPGGDPIAAALAAGETPSPELVANARDKGGIRPGVGVACVLVSILLVVLVALGNGRLIAYPLRSPDELAVEAQRIVGALGYDTLPEFSARGFAGAADFAGEGAPPGTQDGREIDQSAWPSAYIFWRRWSPVWIIAPEFHDPFFLLMDNPPQVAAGSVTVALSSNGLLRGLFVVPDLSFAQSGAVDWGAALALAGIDPASAAEAAPTLRPPVHCDELRAWSVSAPGGDGDAILVHVGSANGRIVYFETRQAPAAGASGSEPPSLLFLVAVGILVLFTLASIGLAWRNFRIGKCDTRSAFRLALIMGALYGFIEFLSIPIVDVPMVWGLFAMVGHSRAGHILLHGMVVFAVYLAIEPYARRIWPRSLVGVVRVLSGRVRDPLVGREILLGATIGIAIGSVLWAQPLGGDLLAMTPDSVQLSAVDMSPLTSAWHSLVWLGFNLANSLLWVCVLMVMLVVARFITPSSVGAAILSALTGAAAWALFAMGSGVSLAVAIPSAIVLGAATILVITRVGFLAAYFTVFSMVTLFDDARLTIAPGEWQGAYSVPTFIALLAPVAYGFVVALAGQPLFKDLLAEPARA